MGVASGCRRAVIFSNVLTSSLLFSFRESGLTGFALVRSRWAELFNCLANWLSEIRVEIRWISF